MLQTDIGLARQLSAFAQPHQGQVQKNVGTGVLGHTPPSFRGDTDPIPFKSGGDKGRRTINNEPGTEFELQCLHPLNPCSMP